MRTPREPLFRFLPPFELQLSTWFLSYLFPGRGARCCSNCSPSRNRKFGPTSTGRCDPAEHLPSCKFSESNAFFLSPLCVAYGNIFRVFISVYFFFLLRLLLAGVSFSFLLTRCTQKRRVECHGTRRIRWVEKVDQSGTNAEFRSLQHPRRAPQLFRESIFLISCRGCFCSRDRSHFRRTAPRWRTQEAGWFWKGMAEGFSPKLGTTTREAS